MKKLSGLRAIFDTAVKLTKDLFSKEYVWVLFILSLGLILRVYQLGGFSLWYDEVISIHEATEFLLIDQGRYELLTFPPLLFMYILHWWINLGTGEFTVRLLSCLFGVASLGVIYALGKRLCGIKCAAISSLLLAVSAFHIYYSRECTSYALWTLMTLLCLYYFLRLLENDFWRDWVGYTVFSIGCIYSHNFGFFLPLISGLFYFTRAIQRKQNQDLLMRGACFYGIIIISSWWVWHVFLQSVSVKLTQIFFWIPRSSLTTTFHMFNIFNAGYNVNMALYVVDFVLFGGLFFLGCARFKNKPLLLLLLSLIFLPIVLVFFISFKNSFYLYRYFIFILPVYYLIVAWGISSLPKKAATCILVAILGIAAVSLSNYYRDIYPLAVIPWRPAIFEKKDYRQAGSYLKGHLQEGDVFIHTSRATFGALWFYIDKEMFRLSKNWIWGILGENEDWEHWRQIYPRLQFQEKRISTPVARDIRECAEGQNRVWLIYSGWEFDSREGPEIKDWFDQNWTRLDQKEFRGLELYLYQKARQDR